MHAKLYVCHMEKLFLIPSPFPFDLHPQDRGCRAENKLKTKERPLSSLCHLSGVDMKAVLLFPNEWLLHFI